METLKEIYSVLKEQSEERLNNFKIEEISSIKRISEEAYLEKPTWLGGNNLFTCVFIDLDDSSIISQTRNRKTVAKIYDYFTQNAVDVLCIAEMRADYIDIKGDGVFGIYEGENAIYKGLVAAITFKTFFEKQIKEKFKSTIGDDLRVKISINQDMVLVKKIGKRGDYNEVWAGKLINNCFKIASLNKFINEEKGASGSRIIVSEDIYDKLKVKEKYTILSCGHSESGKWTDEHENLWTECIFKKEDSLYNETVYFLGAKWCDICGDNYLKQILE